MSAWAPVSCILGSFPAKRRTTSRLGGRGRTREVCRGCAKDYHQAGASGHGGKHRTPGTRGKPEVGADPASPTPLMFSPPGHAPWGGVLFSLPSDSDPAPASHCRSTEGQRREIAVSMSTDGPSKFVRGVEGAWAPGASGACLPRRSPRTRATRATRVTPGTPATPPWRPRPPPPPLAPRPARPAGSRRPGALRHVAGPWWGRCGHRPRRPPPPRRPGVVHLGWIAERGPGAARPGFFA